MSWQIWLIMIIDGMIITFGFMALYQFIKFERISQRFGNSLKEFRILHNDILDLHEEYCRRRTGKTL